MAHTANDMQQLLIPHKTLLAMHKLIGRRLSTRADVRADCKLNTADKTALRDLFCRLSTYLLNVTPSSAALHSRRKQPNTVHALQTTNLELIPPGTKTPPAPYMKLRHTIQEDKEQRLSDDPELKQFYNELVAKETAQQDKLLYNLEPESALSLLRADFDPTAGTLPTVTEDPLSENKDDK